MTFGRPMVITRHDALAVPFPSSINDEFLGTTPGDSNDQPSDSPSVVEFWLQSLKLYVIQEEVLSTFYSHEASSQDTSLPIDKRLEDLDFNSIASIDASLHRWQSHLPNHMHVQATAESQDHSIFTRQANILHLRCVHFTCDGDAQLSDLLTPSSAICTSGFWRYGRFCLC